MKIIEAIKTLRRMGWTQSEIAAKVGLTQPAIFYIESGKVKNPLFETGTAIIELCQRELDFEKGFENDTKRNSDKTP
jgi:transcriptional regulator with XRE-family HTH domain